MLHAAATVTPTTEPDECVQIRAVSATGRRRSPRLDELSPTGCGKTLTDLVGPQAWRDLYCCRCAEDVARFRLDVCRLGRRGVRIDADRSCGLHARRRSSCACCAHIAQS